VSAIELKVLYLKSKRANYFEQFTSCDLSDNYSHFIG
jgi:hypothetical protein